MFKIKKRKGENQIIEKAEDIIKKSGFSGIVEKDLHSVDNSIQKQAFLVEVLLYRYEHCLEREQNDILVQLEKAIRELNKCMNENISDKSLSEIYDEVIKAGEKRFTKKTFEKNGNEISIKAFPCGEYYDGEEYSLVVAQAIYMNNESLYEIIPSVGVWSVATRLQDLKLVSIGRFEDVRDAFGYIGYCCQNDF